MMRAGIFLSNTLLLSVVAPSIDAALTHVVELSGFENVSPEEDNQNSYGTRSISGGFSISDSNGSEVRFIKGNPEGKGREENTFYYTDSRTVDLVFGCSAYSNSIGATKIIEGFEFVYIPWSFIDRIGENPVEALADVVEVVIKATEVLTGKYNHEEIIEKAEKYRVEFLCSAICEENLSNNAGLSKRSEELLEKHKKQRNCYSYGMKAQQRIMPEDN
ncbi:hypothetical protein JW796_00760 [Candidatus Dojkabacteria bacterium]|nr:hypothetical protein [Candidatus Dojkabacteria bacterium]